MKLNSAQDYVLKQLKSLGAKDIVVTSHSGELFQNKFANNWLDLDFASYISVE